MSFDKLLRNTYAVPKDITKVVEEFVPINKRIRKFNVHHMLCMAAIKKCDHWWEEEEHRWKLMYNEMRGHARLLERLRRRGCWFAQSPKVINTKFLVMAELGDNVWRENGKIVVWGREFNEVRLN